MNQNRCHQTRFMGLKCTQNAFAAGAPPRTPLGRHGPQFLPWELPCQFCTGQPEHAMGRWVSESTSLFGMGHKRHGSVHVVP